jgi:hypothetical protein
LTDKTYKSEARSDVPVATAHNLCSVDLDAEFQR